MFGEVVKEDFAELHGYQTALDAYNSSVEGKGAPDIYVMPSSIAAAIYAILGSKSVTGSGDPYTHVITEAAESLYVTVWANMPSGLFQKFVDCKISDIKIHGESGKPLMASLTIMGGIPSFLSAEESAATLEKSNRLLYYDGLAALKVEGTAVPLMRSFDFALGRGTTVIPGDSLTPADSLVGPLVLTVGITTTPADFAAYNRVVYGGASPSNAATATQTVDELAGSPAGFEFTFTRVTASRSLKLAIPRVQRDPFADALSATPGPLVRTNSFKAYKPADGSTIMTATVLNADATIT